MANQNCVNEGEDSRLLGRIVCPLQRLLSWKSLKPPRWLVCFRRSAYGIEYVSFGIAWPPYMIAQKYRGWFDGPFPIGFLLRIGFRYDVNWPGFIFPTAALKLKAKIMERGY